MVVGAGAIQAVDIPHADREVSIDPCCLEILKELFSVRASPSNLSKPPSGMLVGQRLSRSSQSQRYLATGTVKAELKKSNLTVI